MQLALFFFSPQPKIIFIIHITFYQSWAPQTIKFTSTSAVIDWMEVVYKLASKTGSASKLDKRNNSSRIERKMSVAVTEELAC